MIDRAIESVATQAGLTVDALHEAASEQGYDSSSYRAEIERQLLEARVAQLVADPPSDQEIDAELAAQPTDGDEARQRAGAAAWQRAIERAFERLRATRFRAGANGCIEIAGD